jgi:2-desacetyl-2-hydroxyethyl bacteriochlorophyllide A dehydrogenase
MSKERHVGLVVQFSAPGKVELVEEDIGVPNAGQVLVRTLYSGISTGTELTAYRGTNPYLARHWDGDRRLFTDNGATFGYPVVGWGYQEVGRVVRVGAGVTGPRPGDLVWGIWGHRSEAMVDAERLEGHVLPEHVDPLTGVFARLGAIAFNAVLDAGPLLGSTVVVFGQGVLGLLTTRLAVLAGATVIAVEPVAQRRDLARRTGAKHVLDPAAGDTAGHVHQLTGGCGADVCVEISGSYAALHEAIRASGQGGRVVASGFYQGPAAQLRLGEEFHHNRVQLVASQISGVGSALAARWHAERLQRSFMSLVVEGRVDPLGLVTHVFEAGEVAKIFQLLDERPHEALQAVLEFRP